MCINVYLAGGAITLRVQQNNAVSIEYLDNYITDKSSYIIEYSEIGDTLARLVEVLGVENTIATLGTSEKHGLI